MMTIEKQEIKMLSMVLIMIIVWSITITLLIGMLTDTTSTSDVIDIHGPPYKNSIPTYIDEDVMWIGAEGDTLWE